MDTCPVDCIHWVNYEDLPALGQYLAQQELQALGFATASKPRRPQQPHAGDL